MDAEARRPSVSVDDPGFNVLNSRRLSKLQSLLNREAATFSSAQVLKGWLTNGGTLLLLLGATLLIVSLFFIQRTTIRVIVEASLLGAALLFNLFLYHFQHKERHLQGIYRIQSALQAVSTKELGGTEERILEVAKAIIDREREMRPAPIARMRSYLRTAVFVLALVSLAMSLIAVSVRMGVTEAIRPEWPWLFLTRNFYLLLPLLPLSFRLVTRYIYSMQNAKMLTLFQVEQLQAKKRKAEVMVRSPGEFSPGAGDAEMDEQQATSVVPDRKLPYKIVASYFSKLFFSTDFSIPRSSTFDLLGDATSFCCVDKYILSEGSPFPEKILIFQQDESVVLDMKRYAGPNMVEFDTNTPHQQYLSSLKPLGLNCMLMSDFKGTGREIDLSLKSIARVIGFKDSIEDSFLPVRELETNKSEDGTKQMTSLVVREPSGSLQFFSRGDLEFILEHCSDYWDGSGIKPLSDDVRQELSKIYKNWDRTNGYQCVAFAYKHVKPKYNYLFKRSGSPDPVSIRSRIRASSSGSKKKGKGKARGDEDEESDQSDEEVEQIDSPDTSANEDETTEERGMRHLKKIREHQIFIGMVGLRYFPKRIMSTFIETLNMSFVRFVYISEDNERRTKILGDKLGLETDWNSILTLKDPDPTEKQHKQEAGGIEKLPVGLSAIQKHIDEVDNVPLLVKLYCDATPEAKSALLSILQQNGELVITAGSTELGELHQCFCTSDVTIGVDIEHPVAFSPEGVGSPEKFDSDDEDNDSENADSMVPVQQFLNEKSEQQQRTVLSALTQLCASFVSKEKQFIETSLELIKMGRYLLGTTEQCFWFIFGASIFLHVHQLFTAMFFVCTTLDALQLLWLLFIIIPLLALPLLSTPPLGKLMNMISDKNTPIKQTRAFRTALYLIGRTVPGIIVALVTFALTMKLTWTSRDVKEIFGAFDDPNLPVAFSDVDFLAAQSFSSNIMLFAIVWYFVCATISMHNRTKSIITFNPFRNWKWIISSIIALAAQVVWFVVSEHSQFYMFANLQWYIYVLVFAWPVVQIALDEVIKAGDRSQWTMNQEILKLEFDTKLGMHSPI